MATLRRWCSSWSVPCRHISVRPWRVLSLRRKYIIHTLELQNVSQRYRIKQRLTTPFTIWYHKCLLEWHGFALFALVFGVILFFWYASSFLYTIVFLFCTTTIVGCRVVFATFYFHVFWLKLCKYLCCRAADDFRTGILSFGSVHRDENIDVDWLWS